MLWVLQLVRLSKFSFISGIHLEWNVQKSPELQIKAPAMSGNQPKHPDVLHENRIAVLLMLYAMECHHMVRFSQDWISVLSQIQIFAQVINRVLRPITAPISRLVISRGIQKYH
jgi:hypothetical protein